MQSQNENQNALDLVVVPVLALDYSLLTSLRVRVSLLPRPSQTEALGDFNC